MSSDTHLAAALVVRVSKGGSRRLYERQRGVLNAFNTAKIFTLRTSDHVLKEYETLMFDGVSVGTARAGWGYRGGSA